MPKGEKIRVAKKGDPKPGTEFVTVGGKRRPVTDKASFVSLVRGALRSLSPDIKGRKLKIEEAIDEAVGQADQDNKRKK